ncbi:N-acetylglucosamine-6-phosphate deacetylase [Aureimonas psammosilenae]|uniref:N-acetylglucosamine-6-phosphate deacetylase n=1 Tax=Aureimonas psammosilenae TaxID=2495496 RepID=UPI00126132F4|nr:N-acetylglucosamine-6-phosphate deacetylase [Aureimonas psammosilenae]
MTRLVAPEHLWLDGRLQSGLAVETEGGAVTRLRPLGENERADLTPFLLMPAATDLQVNGSGGVMLNDAPSPEAIAHIVETQRRRGTGWVLPTLITTTDAQMRQAADAAIEAWGMPGFLGLHLEGPHMNPLRKGTHDARLFRPVGEGTMEVLRRLRARGIPVMMTLAPEMVQREALREIVELGVVVSIGHTAATEGQARAALEAGARCFTHLFNAMPPMLSREPGVVAAAINSHAHVGIIADGIHVSFEMVALACRARPARNRMFLVSDAMSTIGGPDHFTLYSERIEVRDGALVNAAGSLAGAHIDMVESLRNLVHGAGLPLSEAVAMATDNPRDAMDLPRAAIAPGLSGREFLGLDADLRMLALDP